MTDVFLSYARDDDGEPFEPDRSFLARLHRDLTAAGLGVWFDRVSMPSRALTFHQEILDAIAGRDRLVLVVGPQAVASAYVRQEWQFAHLQAGKVVTPILRQGDFSLVPDELKLLHCEDFRDDRQYALHLANLVRQLSEPVPPLGKLVAVPSLPAHFLSRPERLTAVRDAVRADLDGPVVLGGATARVGLHGMGGIGKSVLAAALAHDRKVREAFPDGVVWVGLGSLPGVAELQRRLHRDLGGDGAFQTEHEGRVKLKDLLNDRRVLLILDDAWRRPDVDAFDVLGPRCRALVTTRDAGLLTSLGGTQHAVELLTDQEALTLLEQSSGVQREQLPAEASQLIAECGRLPLAVALCGGMVRRGLAWAAVLQQLRQARIDRIADRHAVVAHHQSVWHAIHVSVAALPADERQRFLELAVFPPDEATPEAAVGTLWAHTGQCDDFATQELLVTLGERSLVQIAANTGQPPRRGASLHDLVHDYVRRAAGDAGALHDRLLAAYREKCPGGWPGGPDDGYFFTHLRHHLLRAGRQAELVGLLQDLRWLEAKNRLRLIFDLVEDYTVAFQGLPAGSTLLPWYHFVRGQAPVLDLHPELFFQQARNEPVDSPVAQAAREPTLSGPAPLRWLEWLNRPAKFVPPVCLQVLVGHTGGVCSTAISADGRTALSGGETRYYRYQAVNGDILTERGPVDQTTRVWDLSTGQCRAVLPGHTTDRRTAALSADGCVAVTAGGKTHQKPFQCGYDPGFVSHEAVAPSECAVRVWDLTTAECRAVLEGHSGWIRGVAVSHDGCTAVSGTEDGTVRVWDLDTGQCRAALNAAGAVFSVALSGDGKTAVSGGQGAQFSTYDPNRARMLAYGWDIAPEGMEFDWDEKTMRVVQAWDLTTGECRATLEDRPEGGVGCVAISADGSTVVAEDYRNVRVWDLATGRCRATLTGHSGRVTSLALSADGRTAVSGSEDRTVRVWDLTTAECRATLTGHTAPVQGVSVAADGQVAVSGSADGTVRVWDLSAAKDPVAPPGQAGGVTCLAFSPDGRTAVLVAKDGMLQVWDVSTGRLRKAFPTGAREPILDVEFWGEGQTVTCLTSDMGSLGQAMQEWDLETGECRGEDFWDPHDSTTRHKRRFVPTFYGPPVRCGEGFLQVTLENRDRVDAQFPGRFTVANCSADRRHLAAVDANGMAYFFRLHDGAD